MKKKKMNKTLKKFMPLIIIVVLVVIPVAMTIGSGSAVTTGTGSVTTVEVVEASKDQITEELVITGTVASEKNKILFAPVNGTIDACNVKVGQAVKKGDLLASFDLKNLENSYKQSELSYMQSKSEYDAAISSNEKLKAKATEAKKEVGKLEASIKKLEGNIDSYQKKIEELSEAQMDLQTISEKISGELQAKQALLIEAQNQEIETQDKGMIDTLNAEIEKLETSLEKNQAQYADTVSSMSSYTNKLEEASQEMTQQNMSLAENQAIEESGENAMSADQIKVLEAGNEMSELASLDADELLKKGKEGILAPYDGVVSAVTILEGSQVAQGMELITIQSNTEVCVNLEVLADEFDNLHVGDKAEIKIKDYKYSGIVSEMNQIVTMNAVGENIIGATVKIENPDENIFLGVPAKTTIVTDQKENVICIPSRLINTSSDGDFVYVIDEGVVAKKNIEIGISVLDKVEILSGLEEGDQVIADMTAVLSEGMSVEANLQ